MTGDEVAQARLTFLSGDTVSPEHVRTPVLASWRRSRDMRVAADHIELAYVDDLNVETVLARSAHRVLTGLREQLEGQPMSIVLTDPAGVVLKRLTGDSTLERHLDSVLLAPGFNYSEDNVGTNGIGTALEAGGPMHVFGHEHYAENLEQLACAGVPIRDPITGKTIGAVDLTCWRKDAGPLLVMLARNTADQIQRALLADMGTRQFDLLNEYLRVCRRASGIVLAISDDVVMMNDMARSLLGPADQVDLLREAVEVRPLTTSSSVVRLPSGTTVRLHTKTVGEGSRVSGLVVQAKVVDLVAPNPDGGGTMARMLLPGVVGSGALWRRACDDIEAVHETGERLVVEGESGVGKLAILRAVHQRRRPASPFKVLDGQDTRWMATARATLREASGDVVISHVDRLDGVQLRALSTILQELPADACWVAVTVHSAADSPALAHFLRMFPRTVEVPPLRHHIDDVHQLVPFFLARLGYGGALTCSSEALQVLKRSAWPGNIGELLAMLRRVTRRRRHGSILPADLPPGIRTVSSRLLSRLESMERDAIVQSLLDAGGNKTEAARGLGMSRATIYRKIHEYGIVAPGR